MKIYKYPELATWATLQKRAEFDPQQHFNTVQEILDRVKSKGDDALRFYAQKFDNTTIENIEVTSAEIEEAVQSVATPLKEAIEMAKRNIERFHNQQLASYEQVETSSEVYCWQRSVPIQKVGLYIPGGSAPLFSTVLMLAIPARIADCEETILCSPPDKSGRIHPAVLYAAKVAGVHRIFKVGGAQAIAAMAYGTETVPKVFKIFGPGNQYVTAAKQLVSLRDVSIDMPAGPSEVEVLADDTADARFVAADLLSQAEHGTDSQSILVTISEKLAEEVVEAVATQLPLLKRKEIAKKSLESARIIVLRTIEEAILFTNEYAPEHLIISTQGAPIVGEKIVNAGSVFLGNYTPESAGDYASGTNHTLPTNGYAKAYSGVNMDSFMKKITFQQMSQNGLNNLSNAIIIMADNEGLTAHSNAVKIRLERD